MRRRTGTSGGAPKAAGVPTTGHRGGAGVRVRTRFGLMALIVALGACGQKGPLMLPGEPESAATAGPQTGAASPQEQDDEDATEDE
jgi:predicted small lipoprotein YifL